ncbi:restriction endonuclease subunit S [Dysgonomonas capnocytophagoides]|uniref:restriction endonuclease subunit S n=1 Tax=Dysgonomonas capnocytophagoides TaxID=45254 RepID=UPI002923666E|nr:restriction endonuclease subunit S [Dysgonomonas capnocytophagoides]
MEQYKLPSHNNPDKVFIVNRSELEGRFDPSYFSSEYEILDSIIEKYSFIRLNDIAKQISDAPHERPDFSDTGVEVIMIENLKQEGISTDNQKYITEFYHNKLKSTQLKRDDLLMARIGVTTGVTSIVDDRFVDKNISGNITLIRLKEEVNKNFILYYLNSYFGQLYIKRILSNSARDFLTVGKIKSIKIPNVNVETQQKIVTLYQQAYNLKQQKEAEAKALLDSIDSYLLGELGITLPETDNSLEKRVFTSRFSEIGRGRLDPLSLKNKISDFLTGKYKEKKIKEIALNFKSGFGAGKQDQVLDDSGIIQIRPTNIDEQGTLKFDKNVYLPVDNSYNESDFINVDDILFNNTNSQEWVGKTAILKEQQQLLFSNHITKIAVNKEVAVPDYIWLILNSYQKNKIFYSICTNWNNQSGVGLDLLRSLPIPLPPLEKQNEIAQHIQSIREQAKQLQNDAKAILEQAKQEVEQMILG